MEKKLNTGIILKAFYFVLIAVALFWAVISTDNLVNEIKIINAEKDFASSIDGAGTAANPYLISSPEDLILLSASVNTKGFVTSGKFFKQTANITLSNSFTPIGNMNKKETDVVYFSGNYDGNSFRIINLNLSNSTSVFGDLGLFGYASNANITNVILENAYVNLTAEGKSAGCIIGSASGNTTISGCKVLSGSVYCFSDTSNNIGGIIGYQSGTTTINRCNNYSDLMSYSLKSVTLGGMLGKCTAAANISESFNMGRIEVSTWGDNYGNRSYPSEAYAGGITGFGGVISNCYNRAYVNSNSELTSKNTTARTITYDNYKLTTDGSNWDNGVRMYLSAYYTETTEMYKGYAGGISGYTDGNISGCYNTASISGQSNYYTLNYTYILSYIMASFRHADYYEIKPTITIPNYSQINGNASKMHANNYATIAEIGLKNSGRYNERGGSFNRLDVLNASFTVSPDYPMWSTTDIYRSIAGIFYVRNTYSAWNGDATHKYFYFDYGTTTSISDTTLSITHYYSHNRIYAGGFLGIGRKYDSFLGLSVNLFNKKVVDSVSTSRSSYVSSSNLSNPSYALPTYLSSDKWAKDSHINNGYPYLKVNYWQDA